MEMSQPILCLARGVGGHFPSIPLSTELVQSAGFKILLISIPLFPRLCSLFLQEIK